jgi:hypothetical protein
VSEVSFYSLFRYSEYKRVLGSGSPVKTGHVRAATKNDGKNKKNGPEK